MATTKHLIYSFNGVLIFLITFFTFNSISKEKCNIIELINFFIIYFINFFHLYVNFLICEFLFKYSKIFFSRIKILIKFLNHKSTILK